MRELRVIEDCRPLDAPTLSDAEAEATAALFRAVAEPARVKIVNMLVTAGEPVCACAFEPALGLSQPTVSHHLKKLTDVDAKVLETLLKKAVAATKAQSRET